MGALGTGAKARLRVAESDQRLARAAAGGSDAGFATLHQRHRDGLYRTTLSVGCDPDEALEAVGEATQDALRALRRDGPPEHVRGWLHAVARQATFDLLRERRPDGAVDEPVAAKTGVLETVLARDHVHLLMDDVRALSHDQRTALVLRELEGLRYDELGVAMATTPAAVRQSVHQARTVLGDRSGGRDLACTGVRETLDGVGRSARGRRVRAHLDGCPPCRVYANGLRDRRAALGLLFPLLPADAGQAALARALADATAEGAGASAVVGTGGFRGTDGATSANGASRPAWKGLAVGGAAAAVAVAGALAVGLSDSGTDGDSAQVANGALPPATAPGTPLPASGMGGDSELFGDDLFGDGASGDRDDRGGDDDARPGQRLFAGTGGADVGAGADGSRPLAPGGSGPSGGSGPPSGGAPPAPANPAPAPAPPSSPSPSPSVAPTPAPSPGGGGGDGPVSSLAGDVDEATGGALNLKPTLAPVTDPLGL